MVFKRNNRMKGRRVAGRRRQVRRRLTKPGVGVHIFERRFALFCESFKNKKSNAIDWSKIWLEGLDLLGKFLMSAIAVIITGVPIPGDDNATTDVYAQIGAIAVIDVGPEDFLVNSIYNEGPLPNEEALNWGIDPTVRLTRVVLAKIDSLSISVVPQEASLNRSGQLAVAIERIAPQESFLESHPHSGGRFSSLGEIASLRNGKVGPAINALTTKIGGSGNYVQIGIPGHIINSCTKKTYDEDLVRYGKRYVSDTDRAIFGGPPTHRIIVGFMDLARSGPTASTFAPDQAQFNIEAKAVVSVQQPHLGVHRYLNTDEAGGCAVHFVCHNLIRGNPIQRNDLKNVKVTSETQSMVSEIPMKCLEHHEDTNWMRINQLALTKHIQELEESMDDLSVID